MQTGDCVYRISSKHLPISLIYYKQSTKSFHLNKIRAKDFYFFNRHAHACMLSKLITHLFLFMFT